MNTSFTSILVTGLAGMLPVGATTLALDFQPTGGTTAEGYVPYEFTTLGAFPISRDFSAFGTTISVAVNSSNIGDNNDNRSIQRNGLLTDVRNDWIGVDARNAAGGNPEATISITVSGLPVGEYTWRSLLHDGGTGASGPGQGNINGNIRTTFVDALGSVEGTAVISSENPVQPTSSFTTAFTSDGSPVSLTLGSTGVNGDAIFVLTDSLELTLIPEPSAVALLVLGSFGLVGPRRRN
jgi:hypothetical protein